MPGFHRGAAREEFHLVVPVASEAAEIFARCGDQRNQVRTAECGLRVLDPERANFKSSCMFFLVQSVLTKTYGVRCLIYGHVMSCLPLF